jgi:hypothetical protein
LFTRIIHNLSLFAGVVVVRKLGWLDIIT